MKPSPKPIPYWLARLRELRGDMRANVAWFGVIVLVVAVFALVASIAAAVATALIGFALILLGCLLVFLNRRSKRDR